MERQQFEALHPKQPTGSVIILFHNQSVGHPIWEIFFLRHRDYCLEVTITGASTILSVRAPEIMRLFYDFDP